MKKTTTPESTLSARRLYVTTGLPVLRIKNMVAGHGTHCKDDFLLLCRAVGIEYHHMQVLEAVDPFSSQAVFEEWQKRVFGSRTPLRKPDLEDCTHIIDKFHIGFDVCEHNRDAFHGQASLPRHRATKGRQYETRITWLGANGRLATILHSPWDAGARSWARLQVEPALMARHHSETDAIRIARKQLKSLLALSSKLVRVRRIDLAVNISLGLDSVQAMKSDECSRRRFCLPDKGELGTLYSGPQKTHNRNFTLCCYNKALALQKKRRQAPLHPLTRIEARIIPNDLCLDSLRDFPNPMVDVDTFWLHPAHATAGERLLLRIAGYYGLPRLESMIDAGAYGRLLAKVLVSPTESFHPANVFNELWPSCWRTAVRILGVSYSKSRCLPVEVDSREIADQAATTAAWRLRAI